MPKRISVKGRGLGAYFPDEDGIVEASEVQTSKPSSVVAAASPDTSIPVAPEPAAARQAERQPRVSAREARDRAVSQMERTSERISEPAYVNAAFRFTHRELEALDDAVHEIKKKYGARLTKKDVVRLSLASLLDDYEMNGDDSALGQYARSGRQPGS